MKKIISVITVLLFSSISYSVGAWGYKEYTFSIVNSNNIPIAKDSVIIIYNQDTMSLMTDSQGKVTIDINYSYPCRSGLSKLRRLLSSKRLNYGPNKITVIYNKNVGYITKRWRSYYSRKHHVLDRYNYQKGKLVL